MNCPKCQKTMETKSIGDIEVDECSHCRGVWFDRGELDKLKTEMEPDLRWLDFDLWKWKGDFEMTFSPLECPNEHQTPLRTLYFKEVDVRIRFCPVDHGVWLQSGDYLKIIRMLATEAESRELSDYLKASLKEASDIIAHPDRFISEWRDLKAVLRLLKYSFFAHNPRIRELLLGLQKSLPL